LNGQAFSRKDKFLVKNSILASKMFLKVNKIKFNMFVIKLQIWSQISPKKAIVITFANRTFAYKWVKSNKELVVNNENGHKVYFAPLEDKTTVETESFQSYKECNYET
jgi:hypothetical protein